jgi:tRNA-dihydrouridine synthase B
MAEAARLIESNAYVGCVSEVPPSVIDVNMGCPVRKIVGNGEGSALMKNVPLAADIVRAMTRAVNIPVTVKIRAGWDRDSINAVEMAKALEDAGASMICVHARTREQMYEPSADWSVIAAVKSAVGIPVFGNGDIFTAKDASDMIEQTECDGIMVARGAMGNPWIFSEILAAREGREYAAPSVKERFATALGQIEEMIAEKGERIGVAEAKKHLSWYCKGIQGAASVRASIMQTESFSDIKRIVEQLSNR